MKKLWILLFLAGCDGKPIITPDPMPDQCMRREIFQECMKNLPVGPQATKYNDWDDVVDSCGSQAYYLSKRNKDSIKPECKLN